MASAVHIPSTTGTTVVLAHVPPELVFEPKYEEPNMMFDPFIVTMDFYEEFPPVFYLPRPSPGHSLT